MFLPVTAERLQRNRHATFEDPVFSLLIEVIRVGWKLHTQAMWL